MKKSYANGSKPSGTGPADEQASLLALYCNEIGQVNLLSREEEVELARRVRAGDAAAREAMIKANLRLVVWIARGFEGMGLPLLDLISEGNIGLMRAVDRYDPDKGAKVSVYATFWIKQCIRRALCDHGRTIRLPVHLHGKIQTVHGAMVKLKDVLGREPTSDEIAHETGLPADRVQRMRDAMHVTVSLDQVLHDGEGPSVAETVADERAFAPDEALARATGLEQLRECIGELDHREQTILRARFGLDGEDEGTFDKIGRRLRLTRERIRQIQNTALAKLRRKLEEKDRPLVAAQAAPCPCACPCPPFLKPEPKAMKAKQQRPLIPIESWQSDQWQLTVQRKRLAATRAARTIKLVRRRAEADPSEPTGRGDQSGFGTGHRRALTRLVRKLTVA